MAKAGCECEPARPDDHGVLGLSRELYAAFLMSQKGYSISFPARRGERYDFIAEKHPCIYRVQVKDLNYESSPNPDNPQATEGWVIRSGHRAYSRQDCDLVVGVNTERNEWAIVPIEEESSRASTGGRFRP